MNADEARKLTKIANEKKEVLVSKVEDRLVDIVFRRIRDSANRGLDETTLNSLSDYGEGVRGLGFYLSEPVLEGLTYILQDRDFVVVDKAAEPNGIRQVFVRW